MTRLFNSGESLRPTKDEYLDSISVDCVVLSFNEGVLQVLLNKLKKSSKWMLPGGFVRMDENVDAAAQRVIQVRTGLSDVFIKQFHLFGECNRFDQEDNKNIIDSLGMTDEMAKWYLRRFVTMGYYALVEYSQIDLFVHSDEEEIDWFPLNKLPYLYGDHRDIIDIANNSIRMQLGYLPIGYQMLPEKFTMPELRMLYEAFLGKELDRRNFQRKILSVGYVKKLKEKRKVGPHKSPFLYVFDKTKYQDIEKNGMYLIPDTAIL
ncbi:NUDIX hydrolase [Dysgonomonas macrotermitis]|uniref:ADP-ribose pyrophosphatase YjhB, NUDIX family n=1 Tax=Dysgonomonas macrotermitis TaxID=1346286 RepID=A0A1M5H5F3_9BACT|nr:NUDIX domain-containing protein [Dysgonomonas macrotermitis]SHG10952.1 ADP-ribose pyrophosphatase YjhB, NUDIX family [Dysgonomonas macrotermitis]